MQHFSSDRQRYEHLGKEIAGQLLRENSAFQKIKELQPIAWEYQKLVERQRHLEELELKIKAVISVINDLDKDEAKAKAKVVEEEKQLRSYSKELGQSVFAGFKAGDISYHAIFEPRKNLQDRIDELGRNKNNLSNFESLPLLEKLEIQAQYLVIVGQLKVEELKVGFADRSLGEAILDSDEPLPLQSIHTEAVLKSLEEQKRKIKNAKDKAVEIEKLSMEKKAECASSLGRLNIQGADLKAKHRELEAELKANMTRQAKLRDEALDFAIGASEAFADTPVENNLSEIKLLRKTGTGNGPNINNMYYSAKDRISNLPTTTKRRILAASGILIGLLLLSFMLRPSMHQQVELSGSKEITNPKEITNSIGMKLVRIPKGKFLMGSPETEAVRDTDETQHEVILTKDFYLGVFEVTQAEYEKVMGDNPSRFKGAQLPVETVSWEDAFLFCLKLSEFPEERKAGHVYRLPAEAQWEYACRAGTTTPFHFGKALNGAQANCNGIYPYGTTTKGPNLGKTSAVGSYPANAWGLHDMHGNVWEWCADWYGGVYLAGSVTDPIGPATGSIRVYRGGSWRFDAVHCRSANRLRLDPSVRRNDLGFRVALSSSGIPK
ncbi:MAG: hypothetical protein FJ261_08050 [Planctomycetes bacterium]|nr:hypothetical protein [Planctomycetota bacterium]